VVYIIKQKDFKSGNDIEVLIFEEYIKYLLLASVDTGDFSTTFDFEVQSGDIISEIDFQQKIP
jgi:hypothetical protein